MIKPLQSLILSNLAIKMDSEYTVEDLEFLCKELVGRFPATADVLVQKLSAYIQDRDQQTVERWESMQ